MNQTVCVLLSTYNGEKYLSTLLDSVLNQEGVEVHLLIRDDGSSDSTREILCSYQKQHGNIAVINTGNNLGPAESFMELLYRAGDFDYYAFADQDDIWKPNKLKAAAAALKKHDASQNLLYCSNQTLYVDGKEKGLRYSKEPNHTVTQLICGNHIAGCTMVINRALKNYLVMEEHRPSFRVLKMRMHDVWILLVAQLTGFVYYDANSYIDYRIHEENTVGIRKDTISDKFKKAAKKIKRIENRNGRQLISLELKSMETDISSADRRILDCFSGYQDSFTKKIALLQNRQIRKDCEENRGLFVVKTLLNWH